VPLDLLSPLENGEDQRRTSADQAALFAHLVPVGDRMGVFPFSGDLKISSKKFFNPDKNCPH